jgi:predicted DNA-binding transcriptional regulator AlpA
MSKDKKGHGRWLRNRGLASLLNVTDVTIWRWQRDPAINFPQPSVINGIPYTNLDEIDAWMKLRVVNRTKVA